MTKLNNHRSYSFKNRRFSARAGFSRDRFLFIKRPAALKVHLLGTDDAVVQKTRVAISLKFGIMCWYLLYNWSGHDWSFIFSYFDCQMLKCILAHWYQVITTRKLYRFFIFLDSWSISAGSVSWSGILLFDDFLDILSLF